MINQADFIKILRKVASQDTSVDPGGWTPENPLWGHCAIVSLLVQDYFGGELMRGAFDRNHKYSHIRSHFWNSFTEGEIDFTAEQYPDLKFTDLPKELRDRSMVLKHINTQLRYNLLKERFEKMIQNNVTL